MPTSEDAEVVAGPRGRAAAGLGAVALAATLALAVHAALAGREGLVAAVFARPAARLASVLLGVPFSTVPEGAELRVAPDEVVRVGPPCAGVAFFALVAGFLAFLALRSPARRAGAVLAAAAVPLSYAATLAANGLRLAALARTDPLFDALLGPALARVLHEATGVAVFLPVLIALHLALGPRRRCHARP